VCGRSLRIPTPSFGEGLTQSFHIWSNVSPHVVMFAFIPILLFESSFSTDVHIMRHEASQVCLSFPSSSRRLPSSSLDPDPRWAWSIPGNSAHGRFRLLRVWLRVELVP
jgi:hypothetical protein